MFPGYFVHKGVCCLLLLLMDDDGWWMEKAKVRVSARMYLSKRRKSWQPNFHHTQTIMMIFLSHSRLGHHGLTSSSTVCETTVSLSKFKSNSINSENEPQSPVQDHHPSGKTSGNLSSEGVWKICGFVTALVTRNCSVCFGFVSLNVLKESCCLATCFECSESCHKDDRVWFQTHIHFVTSLHCWKPLFAWKGFHVLECKFCSLIAGLNQPCEWKADTFFHAELGCCRLQAEFFFSSECNKFQHNKKSALPMLSMKTTDFVSVECAAKLLKSGAFEKSRNKLSVQKHIQCLHAQWNLRMRTILAEAKKKRRSGLQQNGFKALFKKQTARNQQHQLFQHCADFVWADQKGSWVGHQQFDATKTWKSWKPGQKVAVSMDPCWLRKNPPFFGVAQHGVFSWIESCWNWAIENWGIESTSSLFCDSQFRASFSLDFLHKTSHQITCRTKTFQKIGMLPMDSKETPWIHCTSCFCVLPDAMTLCWKSSLGLCLHGCARCPNKSQQLLLCFAWCNNSLLKKLTWLAFAWLCQVFQQIATDPFHRQCFLPLPTMQIEIVSHSNFWILGKIFGPLTWNCESFQIFEFSWKDPPKGHILSISRNAVNIDHSSSWFTFKK